MKIETLKPIQDVFQLYKIYRDKDALIDIA